MPSDGGGLRSPIRYLCTIYFVLWMDASNNTCYGIEVHLLFFAFCGRRLEDFHACTICSLRRVATQNRGHATYGRGAPCFLYSEGGGLRGSMPTPFLSS